MKFLYPILNLIALAAVLYVNYLANALPINGYTTGELSVFYPNMFVPAGITFSIWGIIYLLLIVFVIAHFVQIIKGNEIGQKQFAKISWLFVATCVLNISWIFSWHYQMVLLSVVVMLLLLISLISIYLKALGNNIFITKAPFSVYLGWISVATIANITAALVHFGFTDLQVFFSVIMIIVAMLLALFFVIKFNDFLFALVIVWAFTGIFIKQNSNVEVNSLIMYLSLSLAVILFIFAAYNKLSATNKFTKVE